jgi:hypothetical protein
MTKTMNNVMSQNADGTSYRVHVDHDYAVRRKRQ